jgi:hypothetical protein
LEDNGGANYVAGEVNISQNGPETFHFHNVGHLCIDGRNYFNACQRDPLWTEMLPDLFDLSVSHFTPVAARSESFRTSDLLMSLGPLRSKIGTILIGDLDLHESPHHVFDDDFDIGSIDFENMQNANCLKEMMDFLGHPEYLQITRCCSIALDLFDGTLSLKLIDKGEDIVEFLTMFRGDDLTIDDCPGFNDNVLNAMTKRTSFNYCAPSVRRLTINNCPNISIPALKQLVRTRCYDGAPRQYPSILGLDLTGRGTEMSPEDESWFEAWPLTFSYKRF